MKPVIFLHPDLGIGGAERLVVDAALALKRKGCAVHFITSHHDPTHCFAETKDGTFPVTVAGDWLPRSIFGRFYALCAYIRMIYAAFYLAFFSGLDPSVVICDQISVCIPILKICSMKVIFYCHFPDQLLSKPGGLLKSLYRAPLNWIEETTTGQADRILVNSRFTSEVFKETFQRLNMHPKVLHPSLNTDFFDKHSVEPLQKYVSTKLKEGSIVFLSINRYERKKNLSLALDAMESLHSSLSEDEWAKVHLIIAGGYDHIVPENVEYFVELEDQYKKSSNLKDHVTFLKSPSDSAKLSLLRGSSCLIYTPENEHFGIVPLEAMYCSIPVIAANSGGPTETVVNEKTGFLCPPNSRDFASAMEKFIKNINLSQEMGKAGQERVKKSFSFSAFSDNLYSVVIEFEDSKQK
ncbi:Alpha-1,3-mannosyltransferase ALG2 [Gryllus bimaculatus]|nr:Alpha-1,3-mannosyltransferase ALG2 [Gryllus bimaculatus]